MIIELESNLVNGYKAAYALACEEIAKVDPVAIVFNAGAAYEESTQTLSVCYLNKTYYVKRLTGTVEAEDGAEVTTTVKVLILHYLLTAKPRDLTGTLISYRQIPNGSVYYPNFQKRAINPLVKVFGNNHDGFYRCAQRMGGQKLALGHASVKVDVFPKLPVCMVLWQGDEEVPNSGNVLFDETVVSFLHVEDIVVAGSFAVYELMGQLHNLKD